MVIKFQIIGLRTGKVYLSGMANSVNEALEVFKPVLTELCIRENDCKIEILARKE